jgi:hypothetical protein
MGRCVALTIPPRRGGDHGLEPCQRERLVEEGVRAAAAGLGLQLRRPVAGEEHDPRLRPQVPGQLDDVEALDAGESGEAQVRDHDRVLRAGEEGLGLLLLRGRVHAPAIPAEVLGEGEADGGLVVDDQQPPGSRVHGGRWQHDPCHGAAVPSLSPGAGPTPDLGVACGPSPRPARLGLPADRRLPDSLPDSGRGLRGSGGG